MYPLTQLVFYPFLLFIHNCIYANLFNPVKRSPGNNCRIRRQSQIYGLFIHKFAPTLSLSRYISLIMSYKLTKQSFVLGIIFIVGEKSKLLYSETLGICNELCCIIKTITFAFIVCLNSSVLYFSAEQTIIIQTVS